VAIYKRIKKGGWKKIKIDVEDAKQVKHAAEIISLPSIENTVRPGNHSQVVNSYYGTRTPKNAAAILENVELGMPLTRVAKYCGIDRHTLDKWIEDDPIFKQHIDEKRLAFESRQIGFQDKAAERGDWKAAAHLLQQSEKDTYDQGEQRGGITVVLNVPKPEETVIDVTPKED
jgi:hypothetical protein